MTAKLMFPKDMNIVILAEKISKKEVWEIGEGGLTLRQGRPSSSTLSGLLEEDSII